MSRSPSSANLQQTRRASSLISFNSDFTQRRGSNVLKFETTHPVSFSSHSNEETEVQKVKGTCSGSHSKPGVKSHMDLMCLGSQARLLLCSMSRCCHPQMSVVKWPALKAENAIPKRTPKCHAHRGQHEVAFSVLR